jgi:hypothetical protein
VDLVRKDLGPLWRWLPQGALYHDPNAYLKSERGGPHLSEEDVVASGSSADGTAADPAKLSGRAPAASVPS